MTELTAANFKSEVEEYEGLVVIQGLQKHHDELRVQRY